MYNMVLEVLQFPIIFGRGLLAELKDIASPKCLVVTMEDLWAMDSFRKHFLSYEDDIFSVYLVHFLGIQKLKRDVQNLQDSNNRPRCIISLGGGQAVDVV